MPSPWIPKHKVHRTIRIIVMQIVVAALTQALPPAHMHCILQVWTNAG